MKKLAAACAIMMCMTSFVASADGTVTAAGAVSVDGEVSAAGAVSADGEVSAGGAVSVGGEASSAEAAAAAADTSASGAAFREEAVKVYVDGREDGELPLRFYEAAPHVPYMGIGEYSQYMYRQELALRENGDGTCIMENPRGAVLLCDPEAGGISVPDWDGFFDLPLPLEDDALGWKDTATRFARITDVEFEGDPLPVELDFAEYGIRIYADGGDIYLPVSTLSNIMTDIATNYILYNGENLYCQRMDLEGKSPEGFFESEYFQKTVREEGRPEDIVRQSYADLCFCFDHFFGHPGKAVLDGEISEKGLDKALDGLGRKGRSIKEGLLSTDLSEYVGSMNKLFDAYLFDGHTIFEGGIEAMTELQITSTLQNLDYFRGILTNPAIMKTLAHELIPKEREEEWGSETYIESGSTAIIRLDSFLPDEQAWDSYYAGEADLPEDCLGTVVSGLRKASGNPDIENVVFDLSCNSGGSPDVMMPILALTTGQDQLYGIHRVTGQRMTFTFEADTNFDGIFDEKDRENRYDFHYGVLVTRHAFSCGNLFPIIIQEGGAVLIGEPSSGGSCCIQVGSDAEGLTWMMSSWQWQLTDSQGTQVEGGCNIDLPIEAEANGPVDLLAGLFLKDEGLPSFKDYFDEARLDEMMNDWFGGEAQADLAA